MLKINPLPILILSFFLFSLKSLAVPNPEYINWRGSPREFDVSLFEGVLGVATHMSTHGVYTFGVVMALRDYNATFVPRSIEYGEMWNFVSMDSRTPFDFGFQPPSDPVSNNYYQLDPIPYDPNSFSNYLDDQIQKIEKYYEYDPNPYKTDPYGSNSNNQIDPNNQHYSDCNDKLEAGTNEAESHTIDLGQYSGSFMFDYKTNKRPNSYYSGWKYNF